MYIQEMQKVLDVHKKLSRDMMNNQINKDLSNQLKAKKDKFYELSIFINTQVLTKSYIIIRKIQF